MKTASYLFTRCLGALIMLQCTFLLLRGAVPLIELLQELTDPIGTITHPLIAAVLKIGLFLFIVGAFIKVTYLGIRWLAHRLDAAIIKRLKGT